MGTWELELNTERGALWGVVCMAHGGLYVHPHVFISSMNKEASCVSVYGGPWCVFLSRGGVPGCVLHVQESM